MSRKCELTGKDVQVGNTVSNANNRCKTRFFPNLTWKRFYVPELKKFVRVKISHRGMRAIDKLGGLLPACYRYKNTLSPKLAKLINQ
jgi:large subunit ribosomal protein L28